MATTDLGKWMITNGGNYNLEATYEQLTMVMYDNSTYITLKTVTGVTPSNDGVNYILMAQGFNATALSAVTATDTSGLLGDSGETVSAQSLIDYLADTVATKLLKKTDIATVQSDSATTVPASALLKSTDDKIGDTSDLPGDAENVVSALVSLNSDIQPTSGALSVNDKGSGTITYTKVANIVFLMLSNISVTQKESPYTYIAALTYPPSETLYQDCIDPQGIIFRITLNSNGLGIQYTGDSPPHFYGIIAYTL